MSRWNRAFSTESAACFPAAARVGHVFACLSAPIDSPQLPPCSHPRSLRKNHLGPAGAAALAEGLKGNTTLQSLEWAAWRSNQSPEGLFCQRPLTRLSTRLCSRARSISANLLGAEGAAALTEGLKGNTTLRSLK